MSILPHEGAEPAAGRGARSGRALAVLAVLALAGVAGFATLKATGATAGRPPGAAFWKDLGKDLWHSVAARGGLRGSP